MRCNNYANISRNNVFGMCITITIYHHRLIYYHFHIDYLQLTQQFQILINYIYIYLFRQRRNYADIGRKLAEEDYANITLSDDEEEETMDQTSPTSGKRRRSRGKGKKKERYYSNQVYINSKFSFYC